MIKVVEVLTKDKTVKLYIDTNKKVSYFLHDGYCVHPNQYYTIPYENETVKEIVNKQFEKYYKGIGFDTYRNNLHIILNTENYDYFPIIKEYETVGFHELENKKDSNPNYLGENESTEKYLSSWLNKYNIMNKYSMNLDIDINRIVMYPNDNTTSYLYNINYVGQVICQLKVEHDVYDTSYKELRIEHRINKKALFEEFIENLIIKLSNVNKDIFNG